MKNQGITLITLIVTIIIILILAGIVITMAIGKNGILNKAEIARQEYTNAQINEDKTFNTYSNLINDYASYSNNKILSAEMFSFSAKDTGWNVKNVQEALDSLYNAI